MRYREVLTQTNTELTEAIALSLGHYDPSEDQLSRIDTARKPKITLRIARSGT